MTSQLRKIDEKGEILANLLKNGRITKAQYDVRLQKLINRAEVLLTRLAS